MTRLRRSFTAEFKLETASQVLDQGYSVPEASRSLDVGETELRCCVDDAGVGVSDWPIQNT
ncbi:transposase [Aeromonas hydrophila]